MKDLRDRAIENGLIDEEGNIQGLGPERNLPFCPDCGEEFWTDDGALYCPCEGHGKTTEAWAPSESIDALRAYVREIRRECQDLPIGVPKALDMIVDELVRLNDMCHETALRVGG